MHINEFVRNKLLRRPKEQMEKTEEMWSVRFELSWAAKGNIVPVLEQVNVFHIEWDTVHGIRAKCMLCQEHSVLEVLLPVGHIESVGCGYCGLFETEEEAKRAFADLMKFWRSKMHVFSEYATNGNKKTSRINKKGVGRCQNSH